MCFCMCWTIGRLLDPSLHLLCTFPSWTAELKKLAFLIEKEKNYYQNQKDTEKSRKPALNNLERMRESYICFLLFRSIALFLFGVVFFLKKKIKNLSLNI